MDFATILGKKLNQYSEKCIYIKMYAMFQIKEKPYVLFKTFDVHPYNSSPQLHTKQCRVGLNWANALDCTSNPRKKKAQLFGDISWVDKANWIPCWGNQSISP